MPDKSKRGMAEIIAQQQEHIAGEPARPARPRTPATTARAHSSDSSTRAESAESRPARPRTPAKPGSSARLRSWYMTADTADALSKAVDELHYSTRAPKYEVLAAIVRTALSDLGPIEAELRAQQIDKS